MECEPRCLRKRKCPWRPSVSKKQSKHIHASYLCSTGRMGQELQIALQTRWKYLWKLLEMIAYKLQLLTSLKRPGQNIHYDFYTEYWNIVKKKMCL